MTFQLKSLGPFRIERTEEYISGAQDNSYAEMIRVKESKPEPPVFKVPSHLYKYSEKELGLYLNERKNLWRQLGELLDVEIDIHDAELTVSFPISKFPDVAKIVPFVKKRGQHDLSDEQKSRRYDRLKMPLQAPRKMKQNVPKFNESTPVDNSIPSLDNFAIVEGSE